MNISPKTKLALMRSLRDKKNPLQKGFTLIELMIVVAIVGILSAVALPNFLGARAAADAGAKVGEAIGLAKECATFISSGGVGVPPTACTSATSAVTISRPFSSNAVGVSCLGDTSIAADTGVSVNVTTAGQINCSFT